MCLQSLKKKTTNLLSFDVLRTPSSEKNQPLRRPYHHLLISKNYRLSHSSFEGIQNLSFFFYNGTSF